MPTATQDLRQRPGTVPLLNARQQNLAKLYTGESLARIGGAAPRVAIVGAGLAGLTAAHLLAKAGCAPMVFEASARLGGRVWSEKVGRDDAAIWELGGEFIDGDHDDMHALAHALGVEIFDTLPPDDAGLASAYRFGGQRRDEAQVERALAALAPRIALDAKAIRARPDHRAPTPHDERFDRMSIAEYLDGLETDPWVRQVIEVAYVTVYGRDASEQSALNLLTLIGTDPSAPHLFGDSDERYKVRAGSQHLALAMAHGLAPNIALERQLVKLRRSAHDWVLGFERGEEVRADAVVLALPFTLLREIDLGELLPPTKRLAVDTLGYGTNSKIMLRTREPVWREAGLDGGCYTDGALQTTWDSGRWRGGSPILTVYLGGRHALAAGLGSEREQGQRHIALAESVFPGVGAAWTGETRRAHWYAERFARGSYTCYRPGQWTAFGGVEGEPLPGGLYFAGEHCATGSQGYMNGAVETGREAALAILGRSH